MPLTDPSVEIQKAVIATLKGSAALTAIIGNKVFDRIKAGEEPPYVNVADSDIIAQLGDGVDAVDSSITVHAWSEAVGFPEVKRMGAAIIAALHDIDLPIDGSAAQSVLLESARYLRDPDGISSHGIFTFNILTDANA